MSGMDSTRMAEMMRAQSAPQGGDPKRFFKDVDMGASISLKAAAPKSFQQPVVGANSIIGNKGPRTGAKLLGSLGIQTNVKTEGLESIKPAESAMGQGGPEATAAVYGAPDNTNRMEGVGLEDNQFGAQLYGPKMQMLNRIFPPQLRNLAEMVPQQLEKIYGAARDLLGAGVQPMAPVSNANLGELSPPATPGLAAARKKGIQGMEM